MSALELQLLARIMQKAIHARVVLLPLVRIKRCAVNCKYTIEGAASLVSTCSSSFTEGLIEKEQFTSRMGRTKNRIADLDVKIKAETGDVDQLEFLRHATKRLHELARAVGPDLANADWHRRREIIRTLVQRIEIGLEFIKIIFRVTQDARCSTADSVIVTLTRP